MGQRHAAPTDALAAHADGGPIENEPSDSLLGRHDLAGNLLTQRSLRDPRSGSRQGQRHAIRFAADLQLSRCSPVILRVTGYSVKRVPSIVNVLVSRSTRC